MRRKSAKNLAMSAVCVALLIAVQFVLGFVPGVELVTVILLAFCYAFGIFYGLLSATAFSLLRCLVFGFVPNVVVLYLVYYNLFALLFGFAGRRKISVYIGLVLPVIVGALCLYFAIQPPPVSILYQKNLQIMLWILFGLMCALAVFLCLLLFNGKLRKKENAKELATVTALAAFCTVCFTLLDDVISPLVLGYSAEATVAYFYTGFLTMLPQTICASVSVFLLFPVLKKLFFRAANRQEKLGEI